MKVILTGATGFVGGEVLRRLGERPDIETVTCLLRRAPEMLPPNATVICHDDFSRYDTSLLDRLSDHTACIWAMGGKASDLGRPDVLEQVTYTFTLAFARAIAARNEAPFTFCYLSGMGADPTETARFPWERLTRHLKGRTERDLSLLQRERMRFCVHSFRPGGILPASANPALDYLLAPLVVRVSTLAEAMITTAVDPQFSRRLPLLKNADIKRLARGKFSLDVA